MKSPWSQRDSVDCVEVTIPPGGIAVFLIGTGDRGFSTAAVVEASDIPGLLDGSGQMTRWIAPALPHSGPRPVFRLVGDERQFGRFSASFREMGLVPGKNVAVAPGASSTLRLFPKEGKILMSKAKARIRVLVVDDSETIRTLLSRIIDADGELECVATVDRPSRVEEAIEKYRPDVITLDIHLPEMDGVVLLKKLMGKYPIPTVMISALSKEDGNYVLDALEAGAVDYIQKPSLTEIGTHAPLICEKIKIASTARLRVQRKSNARLSSDGVDLSYLIVIGSSTGGTEALKSILTELPEKIPPILIVQHIPPVFSKAFADRMNALCPFEVREAVNGDSLEANQVLIAPGGMQMKLVQKGVEIRVSIEDSAPVNRHKPSVDVLFHSVLELGRKKVVAVILTGMGADGARGLLALRKGGARTMAQDEATSVVYGMPREAARIGGAEEIVALDQVACRILEGCKTSRISRREVETK